MHTRMLFGRYNRDAPKDRDGARVKEVNKAHVCIGVYLLKRTHTRTQKEHTKRTRFPLCPFRSSRARCNKQKNHSQDLIKTYIQRKPTHAFPILFCLFVVFLVPFASCSNLFH